MQYQHRKNSKFKMQNSKLQFKIQKGFTLIELLVVMVIILAVGTIIGVILFSALRGTNKTNTITVVRQNGNYAISQMVKTIRNAKSFDSTNCAQGTQYQSVRVTSPTEGQIVFSCDASTISSTSNGTTSSLLDTITSVSLDANSCYFTCTQNSSTDTQTIGIHFSLSQYQASGSIVLPEKKAQIPFETSVSLRNLPR